MWKGSLLLILSAVVWSLIAAGPATAAVEAEIVRPSAVPQISDQVLSCEGIGTKPIIYMVIYMVRFGGPATRPGIENGCPAALTI